MLRLEKMIWYLRYLVSEFGYATAMRTVLVMGTSMAWESIGQHRSMLAAIGTAASPRPHTLSILEVRLL